MSFNAVTHWSWIYFTFIYTSLLLIMIIYYKYEM